MTLTQMSDIIGIAWPIAVVAAGWIVHQLRQIISRFDSIDDRLAAGSKAIAVMTTRLDTIDRQVNHANEGDATLREMVSDNNARLARLEGRLDA